MYSKTHTKVLLKLLKLARVQCPYIPCDCMDSGLSIDDIKAELAKREHVMNKKEAKAYRQKRAKAKR